MSAQALVCQAQMIHSTLLAMNHQKPWAQREVERDATSQAANKVTAMAGH